MGERWELLRDNPRTHPPRSRASLASPRTDSETMRARSDGQAPTIAATAPLVPTSVLRSTVHVRRRAGLLSDAAAPTCSRRPLLSWAAAIGDSPQGEAGHRGTKGVVPPRPRPEASGPALTARAPRSEARVRVRQFPRAPRCGKRMLSLCLRGFGTRRPGGSRWVGLRAWRLRSLWSCRHSSLCDYLSC
jgi:hypothetical protein